MNRRRIKRNAHAICPVNSNTIWCESSAHWRQRILLIPRNPELLRPNDAVIRPSMANEANEQSITRKYWFLHEAHPVPVTVAPKTKRLDIDERSNVERAMGKQQVKIEYVVPGNSIQYLQSSHPPFSCSHSFFRHQIIAIDRTSTKSNAIAQNCFENRRRWSDQRKRHFSSIVCPARTRDGCSATAKSSCCSNASNAQWPAIQGKSKSWFGEESVARLGIRTLPVQRLRQESVVRRRLRRTICQ